MPKKYPPLQNRDVIKILKALGFTHKRTKGDHAHYEKRHSNSRYLVTVDLGRHEFSSKEVKSMIKQLSSPDDNVLLLAG